MMGFENDSGSGPCVYVCLIGLVTWRIIRIQVHCLAAPSIMGHRCCMKGDVLLSSWSSRPRGYVDYDSVFEGGTWAFPGLANKCH